MRYAIINEVVDAMDLSSPFAKYEGGRACLASSHDVEGDRLCLQPEHLQLDLPGFDGHSNNWRYNSY